jgi:hypothetical protein
VSLSTSKKSGRKSPLAKQADNIKPKPLRNARGSEAKEAKKQKHDQKTRQMRLIIADGLKTS